MACFASTGISPMMSGSSRSSAPVRSKRTVAIAGRFGFRDLDVIGAEIRPALVAQQLPRENNVVAASQACRPKTAPPD